MVAAACSELGLYLTSTGKAVSFHTLGTLQNHAPAESEISQVTINTEARDAIKDLFPNIPQHDLYQIIKTAFQKVGLSGALQRKSERGRLTFSSGTTEGRHGNRIAFGSQGTAGGRGTYPSSVH